MIKKRWLTRLLSLFAAMLMCVSLVPVAFAEEVMTIPDNSLEEAEYLSHEEVLQIAWTQIYGYISTEIDNASEVLIPAGNFIPISDLRGNLLAYLVPLMQDSMYRGYIVVGALRDGFSTYYISLNSEETDKIMSVLTNPVMLSYYADDVSYSTVADTVNSENSLVLVPPLNLFLKISDADANSYYDVLGSGTWTNVSDTVAAEWSELNSIYSTIRSADNEAQIQQILCGTAAAQERAAIYEAQLSSEANGRQQFIPIWDGNRTYYGGNQNWLSGGMSNNGCGPVAAANVTYYLSTINSRYSSLYPYETISKTDFIKHMEKLYGSLNPGPIGITSYETWASRTSEYMFSCGANLNYMSMPAASAKDSCALFIRNGLNINSPVACLNAKVKDPLDYTNPDDIAYRLYWHWVTITKYFQNSLGSYIALSSLGTRYSVNWDTYYGIISQSPNSGFVYFRI